MTQLNLLEKIQFKTTEHDLFQRKRKKRKRRGEGGEGGAGGGQGRGAGSLSSSKQNPPRNAVDSTNRVKYPKTLKEIIKIQNITCIFQKIKNVFLIVPI